jgi:hypothetical protein
MFSRTGEGTLTDDGKPAIRQDVMQELASEGASQIESTKPEAREYVVVEISGPDGKRHIVRFPCGVFAEGWQRP